MKKEPRTSVRKPVVGKLGNLRIGQPLGLDAVGDSLVECFEVLQVSDHRDKSTRPKFTASPAACVEDSVYVRGPFLRGASIEEKKSKAKEIGENLWYYNDHCLQCKTLCDRYDQKIRTGTGSDVSMILLFDHWYEINETLLQKTRSLRFKESMFRDVVWEFLIYPGNKFHQQYLENHASDKEVAAFLAMVFIVFQTYQKKKISLVGPDLVDWKQFKHNMSYLHIPPGLNYFLKGDIKRSSIEIVRPIIQFLYPKTEKKTWSTMERVQGESKNQTLDWVCAWNPVKKHVELYLQNELVTIGGAGSTVVIHDQDDGKPIVWERMNGVMFAYVLVWLWARYKEPLFRAFLMPIVSVSDRYLQRFVTQIRYEAQSKDKELGKFIDKNLQVEGPWETL